MIDIIFYGAVAAALAAVLVFDPGDLLPFNIWALRVGVAITVIFVAVLIKESMR
jgi:hypothetical protein